MDNQNQANPPQPPVQPLEEAGAQQSQVVTQPIIQPSQPTQQPQFAQPLASQTEHTDGTEERPRPKINKLVKILIVIGCIAVIIMATPLSAIFFLIIGGAQSTTSTCSKQESQFFAQSQTVASRLDAINFVPAQPDVKTETRTSGDCFDSLPEITASRNYTVTATAGESFDTMVAALTANSYVAKDNSLATTNPCFNWGQTYSYVKSSEIASANPPSGTISIGLACEKYGTKDDTWRQVPVTGVVTTLTVNWQS